LEKRKKAIEVQQKGMKRKASLEEIDELKKNRDCSRIYRADDIAQKAGRLHSVKYISQSNSMCRSANEKRRDERSRTAD